MRRLFLLTFGAALLALQAQPTGKWTTILDGKSLTGWSQIGNANWKANGGVIEATDGSGFLMTAARYKDFDLRAEFWVDDAANSGVFLRCQNLAEVTQGNSYEVNIYDKRPDQKYATGAIVDVASPSQPMLAGGKWNKFEISAHGKHLVVKLNGVKTVDVEDGKFGEGPISLQRTLGVVRFRKVEIRPS
jgi:Domain of Unknown Function (DUF1080)